jgi:peptidoglycan lytic transglycosylase
MQGRRGRRSCLSRLRLPRCGNSISSWSSDSVIPKESRRQRPSSTDSFPQSGRDSPPINTHPACPSRIPGKFLRRPARKSNAPISFCRNSASQVRIVRAGIWIFCEVHMRMFSKLVAIATVSASLGFYVNPAAAQNFEDRWSIIPKAHADPAPAPPDQTKPEPQAQPPSSDTTIQDSENSNTGPRVFSGKASFYSYRTGKTASGSSFDRDLQTAAHRSLPFGTKVRVTVPATNKSVVVRITDRGPNIRDRVLDLSLGAARNLGIRDKGVVEIRAEVL